MMAWMYVWDAPRLKALEDENGKLKKLLSESMLDVSTAGSSGPLQGSSFTADQALLGWR